MSGMHGFVPEVILSRRRDGREEKGRVACWREHYKKQKAYRGRPKKIGRREDDRVWSMG